METDKVRCGIFPCTFTEDFGYRKYAEYLYKNPPILIMDEAGNAVYTENKKLSEIYAEKEMTKNEIEHAISMFFPDVRLKNYIEIRMADSMEPELVMSYTAMIKAIFYRKEIREELRTYFGEVSEKQIEQAKRSLIENGCSGEVYGKLVTEILRKLKELLETFESNETKQYINYKALFERMEVRQKKWQIKKKKL